MCYINPFHPSGSPYTTPAHPRGYQNGLDHSGNRLAVPRGSRGRRVSCEAGRGAAIWARAGGEGGS